MISDDNVYPEVQRKTHFLYSRDAAIAGNDEIGHMSVDYFTQRIFVKAVTVAYAVGNVDKYVQPFGRQI